MVDNTEPKIYFADLESTGLLHHLIEQGDKAKLHNFCAMSVDGKNMWTLHTDTDNERNTLQRFLDRDIILVMHNGIQYDKYALKHFGYDIDKVHFVDTLALSWYLDLYRAKHGLESYGEESGVPKPVIDDWEKLTQADYDNRVQEDVKIQEYTYRKLKGMFEELYGKMSDYDFCTHKVVRYLNFKMQQLAEQQNTKFRIDVEHAKSIVEKLEKEIEFKTEQLRQAMPKVAVYAKHKKPTKPYKKDGTLSATGEKWRDITFEYGYDFDFDGEIKVVKKYDDPNPSSTQQVKDWLFSLGWNPQTFKFVKDDTGERKIPQIYVQGSGGQVCESIVELSEENPELEHLVGLGVLTHRKGCVQGFLDSVQFGEYVEAGANGFTNTLRLKHKKPVVNLPSTRVLYGVEVRSCLISRIDKTLLGADLSALENILKFNFQMPYDPEYVKSQMSDDFDPHLAIACLGGLLSQDEVNFYKIEKEGFDASKYDMTDGLKKLLSLPNDDKKLKIGDISKIRGKGKGTNYSCQYGAGKATVARTAGVDIKTGGKLHKAYNDMNWSINKIAESQKVKETSHGKYQLNPLNNIWYRLKTDKDKFSTLVQGSGSYVLDCWLLYLFSLRDSGNYKLGDSGVKLLASQHDEMICEFDDGNDSEVKRLCLDALEMVNKVMKLDIPFGCDVQFGKKYSEIH